MVREANWTELDDLLGLREWLKNVPEDMLAQMAPATTQSRAQMLKTLDELIEICSKTEVF